MMWLLAVWGRLKGWLLVCAAAVAVILGAFFRGRNEGRRAAERERDAARLEAIRQAKGIDDDVDALGDADLDQRYRRWLRDNAER